MRDRVEALGDLHPPESSVEHTRHVRDHASRLDQSGLRLPSFLGAIKLLLQDELKKKMILGLFQSYTGVSGVFFSKHTIQNQ